MTGESSYKCWSRRRLVSSQAYLKVRGGAWRRRDGSQRHGRARLQHVKHLPGLFGRGTLGPGRDLKAGYRLPSAAERRRGDRRRHRLADRARDDREGRGNRASWNESGERADDAFRGAPRGAGSGHLVPQGRQVGGERPRAIGSSSQIRAQMTSSSETSLPVRYSGMSSASASRFTRVMYFALMNGRAISRSRRFSL